MSRGLLLRQQIRAVNDEWRGLYKSKEKTPVMRERMKALNGKRIDLAVELVALTRSDPNRFVA